MQELEAKIKRIKGERISIFGEVNPVFVAAYLIAEEAHKNQKRDKGNPYMDHIDAVVQGVKHHNYITKAVAALHDVIEDCPEWNVETLFDHLRLVTTDEGVINTILEAVLAISKRPKEEETYAQYIQRVFNNQIARVVKISDLTDNSKDLTRGNRLDKYQLAKTILEFGFHKF